MSGLVLAVVIHTAIVRRGMSQRWKFAVAVLLHVGTAAVVAVIVRMIQVGRRDGTAGTGNAFGPTEGIGRGGQVVRIGVMIVVMSVMTGWSFVNAINRSLLAHVL